MTTASANMPGAPRAKVAPAASVVALLLAGFLTGLSPMPAKAVEFCPDRGSLAAFPTCLLDGGSGRQRGQVWSLLGVEAPSIDAPYAACRAEQQAGLQSRRWLRALMARGYTIINTARRDSRGRPLVRIELADGRDVATEMLSAGHVQARPNRGNRWCTR